MKKWLDKYQSKGEVKKPVYQYESQNLTAPNFNGLATTTYGVTPKKSGSVKNNNKKRSKIKLQNQIFANNTKENVLDNRRNYYFPYETEQTKNIRNLADEQVFQSSGDLISAVHPIGAVINALYQGADKTFPAEALRYLPNKIPFKQARGYNRLIPILKPASKLIDPIQMFDKLRIADSLYNSADSIDLYNQFKNGGLVSKNSLNRKVTCSNCGWSWKLSDGGEDPLTCHKCGGTIKMKHGGELDKYKEKGEVKSTFNPYENVNRVSSSDGTKVFRLNPEQVENAKKTAAIRNEKVVKEYQQNQRSFIGPDKRTKAERDRSIAARKAYDELVEKQKVMSQQPFYQTLQSTTAGGNNPNAAYNPVIGNTAGALGYTAAGALLSPVVRPAINFMGEAMNAPIQGIPGLTGSNIVNAGFATHGLKSIMDGSVARPWKEARRTGNPWDYANAVNENLMTAMELAPLVGPGYRGVLEAGNYAKKQAAPYILSNRFNKLIKNTNLSELNNSNEQGLISRLNLLDKSSIGFHSDINELYKNYPQEYNALINQLFNEHKNSYLRPLIRFKNTQPHSYIENLTSPSKNKTLFKEKMCPPGSECAKTANSVNNYLFKEITGNPFDYNANAHNAWHMEDQMTMHGGKNVTPTAIIGDRLLMGNGVNQSTYVPGMIADPNVRHAGVYAGDVLYNGTRIPMAMESGKNNPLYLNPISHTFTGQNSVLKTIRPYQHNNSDFLKNLVERNIRYAYRNKPSIYNSFSFDKNVQKVMSDLDTYRDEVKNTYDLTNDEFDQLRNSLIGIGAQETKLGRKLSGTNASKYKILLQDILANAKLTAPIKSVKGNTGKVLNKLIQPSSKLLPYPGSANIEKEAAILSQDLNISFEKSLQIVKNKYQPKPLFSENTTSPSKGIFRQKFQVNQDRLADVNSKNQIRNALGQMSFNYNKIKKLYPNATPSQLMDITTLMWNSPGKAVNKELTDFYIFGKNNPNISKFKFDYVDKVNKYKNKLIENPINKPGLEKYFEPFNEQGPEIYYKNGGAIINNSDWEIIG